MPRDADTLDHYAVHLAGSTRALAYLPAASEADAVTHYLACYPTAEPLRDRLRATPVARRS